MRPCCFILLAAVLGNSTLVAQDNLPRLPNSKSDPTVPPKEVRERLQSSTLPVLAADDATNASPSLPTPQLVPKVRIRSMVLASDRSGVAQIEIAGEKFRVTLKSDKYDAPVRLTSNHFSRRLATSTDDEDSQAIFESLFAKDDLSDLVQADNLILDVVSFTDRQVIFMAYPIGKLIIAR